jgi:hypothetical protein
MKGTYETRKLPRRSATLVKITTDLNLILLFLQPLTKGFDNAYSKYEY